MPSCWRSWPPNGWRRSPRPNAPRRCGLPIGNLSSQFFANVFLDALDQFVKHELKAQRYLRYVDDFVLFHHDRAQLVEWQRQIEAFLTDTLDLRLKDEVKLRRLDDGLDFLGYVIYPTHTRVRRRVVAHLQEALNIKPLLRDSFDQPLPLEVWDRIQVPVVLLGRWAVRGHRHGPQTWN